MSPWKHLTLTGATGTYLRRWAFDLDLFGVYLHRIDSPDPGIDLHDHSWGFISIVLRGGYDELISDVRCASYCAKRLQEDGVNLLAPRQHRRWSVHHISRNAAHRISAVEPGTVTLVFRGRRSRHWGFYVPDGWIVHTLYNSTGRRPLSEEQS